MAIGQPEPETIDIVDWDELYQRITNDDPIIEGLAYRGRWTAIASPAKAGKSTVLLALAVETARSGVIVLYLDAEMGRSDVLDRVEDWMSLKPVDLVNLHYSDLPPKLDTVQGAAKLWTTVDRINPDLVVIDGINGVVNGAENEDTTWRDMYEWAIMPLKERNIAIVSADNMGKVKGQGPRGSSVKLDKADAVLELERTETGVKITTTHRRTSSYPLEQEYTVLNADEGDPPMTVTRVGAGSGAPHGTNRMCAILDELDVPLDAGKKVVRRILKEAGHEVPRDTELLGMLRWRRQNCNPFDTGSEPAGTSGNQRNHGNQGAESRPDWSGSRGSRNQWEPVDLLVPEPGNQYPSTCGSERGDFLGTPPLDPVPERGSESTPERDKREPPPTIEDALG